MTGGNETVAVVGTGTMGAPIARNLAAAGFEVNVWNRSRSKAEALSDVATVAGSPAEAAAEAGVVLTMLADDDAVAAAMEGADGALGAMDGSAAWIQMSTVGIEATGRLGDLAADAGVTFLDAPVLGTKEPAEQGNLTVLASGPEAARDRCERVFEAIGRRTPWLGPAGTGTRLKLVLNTWLLSIVEGLGEAIALAEALEIDPRRFLETVDGGPLGAPYAQLKGGAMIDRAFDPSFSLRLARKDAGFALSAASGTGARLAALEATANQLDRAIESGHGDEDLAAAVYAALADG